MEYRKTNAINVSCLTFGCEPLGGTDWGHVNPDAIANAIHQALDAGVNVFDTADIYGLGVSEERLAKILGHRRHELYIATKGGLQALPAQPKKRARIQNNCSAKHLTQAVEDSLRRLQLDVLPIYYVHWPDPNTDFEETFSTLARLREQGKILHVGCSNFTLTQLQKAGQYCPIQAVQLPYNLLERSISSELINYCQQQFIALFVYGPLACGLLTGKYQFDTQFDNNDRRHRLPQFQGNTYKKGLYLVDKLKSIAKNNSITPAQISLRWLLNLPWVDSVIVGIKTTQQWRENCASLHWHLTLQEQYDLDTWEANYDC